MADVVHDHAWDRLSPDLRRQIGADFKSLLGEYEGWVVADALGTHQAGARECRGVRLAACWAHVLRRFRDAVVDFPEAQFMLAWIQDLYRIDASAKDMAPTEPPPDSARVTRSLATVTTGHAGHTDKRRSERCTRVLGRTGAWRSYQNTSISTFWGVTRGCSSRPNLLDARGLVAYSA